MVCFFSGGILLQGTPCATAEYHICDDETPNWLVNCSNVHAGDVDIDLSNVNLCHEQPLDSPFYGLTNDFAKRATCGSSSAPTSAATSQATKCFVSMLVLAFGLMLS
jgi:hypothetical protein